MAALIPGMGGWELILILFIVLILFGPKRLPALGKSLGKTMKAIREGVDGKDDTEAEDEDAPAKPKAKKKDKADDEDEDEE